MQLHTLQTVMTTITLPQQVHVTVSQQQVQRLQVSLHMASAHFQHLETQQHLWLSFIANTANSILQIPLDKMNYL